ncbi:MULTISPECIES: hypothetical protein [unclassified Pseudomonas]|uniref:hypothetical protein n=1 Tax=unclassified Pseudomonas TaxID=196821 RepID=UPI000D39AC7E|nr:MULTISPECIES: hypothetical protein [unclassified Pseudomonas]RAU46588.1 hypothetical protein DBP26_010505 [Pseudomonas sp. RIT 409]RAU52399.1 hypothetical protein DBY65_017345 [Pseudomonas sp. RIT 412]
MSTTDQADEVQGGSVASTQGAIKSWRRFDTAEVFFQLIEKQLVGGDVDESIVFISDPYELRRTIQISRAINFPGIQQVKVCTPGRINGTNSWSQDTLHALYLGTHKFKRTVKIIYITSGGTFGLETNENLKMFEKKIIYQALDHPIDLFDDFIPLH